MPGHVAVEVLRQLTEAVRLGSAAAHASVGRRADWVELSGGSRQAMVMASLQWLERESSRAHCSESIERYVDGHTAKRVFDQMIHELMKNQWIAILSFYHSCI